MTIITTYLFFLYDFSMTCLLVGKVLYFFHIDSLDISVFTGGVVMCFTVINSCLILFNVSFQPVLHNWCNKARGMCYPVCGMVHIKEPLLLIDKSSLCGGSGFPF